MAYRTVLLSLALCAAPLACADDNPAFDPQGEGESETEAPASDTDAPVSDTDAPVSDTDDEHDSDTDDAGSSSTGDPSSDIPPPSDEVDYDACENGLSEPDCEGIDCADDYAHDAVAVLLEVVDEADLGHVFSIANVNSNPGTDQVLISYVFHVDWFRTRDTFSLRLPLTNDELRETYESRFAELDIPTEVAPLETIEAVVSGCMGLEFDPCGDNWSDFDVHVQRDGADECADISVAVVDVVTGDLLYCEQESVACG